MAMDVGNASGACALRACFEVAPVGSKLIAALQEDAGRSAIG
ncbi:hypothetical protein [Kocuria sp. U4B]